MIARLASPIAWRWHWNGGDEPDVWAYSESLKVSDQHITAEPLYAATATLQALIDKAVEAERKRCAAIARRIGKEYWDTFAEPGHSDEIAEAIERGET